MLSLLRFLEFKPEKLLEEMDQYIKETYPPILVLMNINGLLVHRTNEMVKFTKEDNEKAFKRQRVQVFRQGKNYVYTREGYMAFLTELMNHPRVYFAFNTAIMRKNVLSIISGMFKEEKSMYLL